MWNVTQAAQNLFEELRRKGEPVASANEYVAHLWGAAQVVELRLVILAVEVLRWVANDARTRAVAAL